MTAILFWGIFTSVTTQQMFAQGATKASVYDAVEEKDRDRPELRDRWMMRGRTALAGQSPAALRLRAHQQRLAMRAATAKRTASNRSRDAAARIEGSVSTTPWVPLGPAPLISDQNFFGTVAGRATAVAMDPTDATGNTVYVAASSGGVWKSSNAASVPATNVTWTAVTDQQESLVNGAVSVKPDGSVVLVGTGEPNSAIDSYYGVGVLRSTDHGASWSLIQAADAGMNSFAGLGFAKFAWNAANVTSVVAATGTTAKGFDEGKITNSTNRGLYYSNDSGQTWAFQVPQDAGVAISPASISATDVAYNATAGRFFAVIRYHGVYSSTNGQNWTRLTNQPNAANLSTTNCPAQIPDDGSTCPLYRGQIAVVPGRMEMYFWSVNVVTQSGYVDVVDEGIWRSLDGGNTWAQIDETGIPTCGDPQNYGCGVEQGYYNLEIVAMPNGQATDLYAGAVNLFKCKLTGGTTCTTLDLNYPNQWINLTHVYGCSSIASVHPDEHGLDFLTVGGKVIMYFANDGGIYRTLDGLTALVSGTCGVANGFDNLNASSVVNGTIGSLTQFVSFSIHPTDQNTVLGGTQDNGSPATSAALGDAEWTTVNGGDGGYNAINIWTPSQWYAAKPFVNIYMCASGISCTTDTFNLTVSSGEVGGDMGAFYTPFILDPQNPTEMLVGTCRVWRGMPTVPPSSFTALSVNFDTFGQTMCTGEEINLVSGLAEGGPTVGGFSTTVYATTEGTGPNATPASGGEVWVTTNAGIVPMAPVTATINPSNYTISSVATDTSDATGATAYVGIMGFNVAHVFKTTNAGTAWTDWSGSGGTALPDSPVNALLVDAQETTVYAGTDVGLFMSSTASPSWTEVGTPSQPGATGYLPNVPVTAIRIFSSAGTKKIRVSTYGRGIWEFALETTPDFSLAVTETPNTTVVGQLITWSGMLTALNGYNASVNLSCTGAAPTTCTVNPASLVPTASGAAFTVTLGNPTVNMTGFSFSIQGTDGTLTHSQPANLTVGTDVTWSDTGSNSATVQAGQPATYTFSAAPAGATTFSGTVSFSCLNLPPLASCSFSPTFIAVGAGTTTVTLTIATAPSGSARKSLTDSEYPARRENPAHTAYEVRGTALALTLWPAIPVVGLILLGGSRRRPKLRPKIVAYAVAVALLALLFSCGGLSGGGNQPPQVTVTVSPSAAAVPLSGQKQFTAKVNNGSSQTVTWAVTGGSANGTIDGSGLYTAPPSAPNPATATVTATSTQATSPGRAAVNFETGAGTYSNILVAATAVGGLAHTDSVTLTVQ